MTYVPNNPNGQATMANSQPVVLPSDQTHIPIQGDVAAGATDSGNPAKVGGKYNATVPTLTDGQRGDIQLNNKSIILVNPTAAFGSAYNGMNMVGNGGDGSSGSGTLWVASSVHNGLTYDFLRTPAKFFSAQATASGDTAVWTPGTGKKFRIMAFKVIMSGNATQSAAGVVTIKLRDGTTDLNLTHDVYVPSAAITTQFDYDSGWVNLGNGAKSAAANNVLNVNLSAALTAGNVRVIVAGTEE